MRGESAVDDKLRAVDERGSFAGEEEERGRDVTGTACSAHGRALDIRLLGSPCSSKSSWMPGVAITPGCSAPS
ncbi:hypothetical protein [Streptomyces angustmyceticus]